MHPYLIEELCRMRRHEIDNEFKHSHLVHKKHSKPSSLIRRNRIEEICRTRRHEIDNEFKHSHLVHKKYSKPSSLIKRILKFIYGNTAEVKKMKNAHENA